MVKTVRDAANSVVLFSPGGPAAPLSMLAGSVALRPTLSNGLPLSSLNSDVYEPSRIIAVSFKQK